MLSFVAAIIPFIADIVAFTTAFVALAVCFAVSLASFNARCEALTDIVHTKEKAESTQSNDSNIIEDGSNKITFVANRTGANE